MTDRERVAHMLGRGPGLTDREHLASMADELVRDGLLKDLSQVALVRIVEELQPDRTVQ